MSQTISSEQNNGIEEPLEQSDQNQTTSTLLSENDAVKFEQRMQMKMQLMDRKEKHALKKYGFQLIIGCLIGYFIIVILDFILCNSLNWETSSIASSFVELLKFLVSTLIGFVFSENTKNKNN